MPGCVTLKCVSAGGRVATARRVVLKRRNTIGRVVAGGCVTLECVRAGGGVSSAAGVG